MKMILFKFLIRIVSLNLSDNEEYHENSIEQILFQIAMETLSRKSIYLRFIGSNSPNNYLNIS